MVLPRPYNFSPYNEVYETQIIPFPLADGMHKEVACLIGRGFSCVEIARALGLREHVAQAYIDSLFRYTRSKGDLVRMCLLTGTPLVPPPTAKGGLGSDYRKRGAGRGPETYMQAEFVAQLASCSSLLRVGERLGWGDPRVEAFYAKLLRDYNVTSRIQLIAWFIAARWVSYRRGNIWYVVEAQ